MIFLFLANRKLIVGTSKNILTKTSYRIFIKFYFLGATLIPNIKCKSNISTGDCSDKHKEHLQFCPRIVKMDRTIHGKPCLTINH